MKRIILLLLFSLNAYAYPEKTVRIVVPQSIGGSTDIAARILSKHLNTETSINHIIHNKPGAGSITGTEYAAKATPDGHTLLIVATSFTITPALIDKLPYDPTKDFTPISQMVELSNVVVVLPKSDIKIFSDLFNKQVKVGYSGVGTSSHLAIEMLLSMSKNKFDFLMIPYRGGAPALQAVFSSEVDVNFAALSSVTHHIKNNQIRAIATTNSIRIHQFPNIPTISELGFRDFRHIAWVGIFAPANTPTHITNIISKNTNKVLTQSIVREQYAEHGMEIINSSSNQFKREIETEIRKYKILVKERNIRHGF